jgi:hypothetical protein
VAVAKFSKAAELKAERDWLWLDPPDQVLQMSCRIFSRSRPGRTCDGVFH